MPPPPYNHKRDRENDDASDWMRLRPDKSAFMTKILQWIPPRVITSSHKTQFRGPVSGTTSSQHKTADLLKIPQHIENTAELLKFMNPHLLEEGLSMLHKEFQENSSNGTWSRRVWKMCLESYIKVGPCSDTTINKQLQSELYELQLTALEQSSDNHRFAGSGEDPISNSSIGDIFVMTCRSWTSSTACLGMIDSVTEAHRYNKPSSPNLKNCFRILISVADEASQIRQDKANDNENITRKGWLSQSDLSKNYVDGRFAKQTLHIMFLGSLNNIIRQYEGLKSIFYTSDHIKNIVFHKAMKQPLPQTIASNCNSKEREREYFTAQKPSSIPHDVWNHLSMHLNAHQLSTVESIMSGRVKDNIMLVQGPPGTGKTTTIVGMVSALLNGTLPLPGRKRARIATKIQVGCSFNSSSEKVDMYSTCHSPVPVSCRILVCAVSNVAVNELAWRIHKGSIGPSGKVGDLNVVRYGMLPGEEGKHKNSRKADSYIDEAIIKELSCEKEDYLCKININGHSSHNDKKGAQRSITDHKYMLNRAHVVCTTLSGSGSYSFINMFSQNKPNHNGKLQSKEFDVVIIDEACQATEAMTLIPFKYNPNLIVLVGDPKQLPPVILSDNAKKSHFERSLFTRLQRSHWPIQLLQYQYRMHESIARMTSKQFYDGVLETHSKVTARKPMQWYNSELFPPLCVWDIHFGRMSSSKYGVIFNNDEVAFINDLLMKFAQNYCGKIHPVTVGIIAFYSAQVAKLKKMVTWVKKYAYKKCSNVSFKVSTVDGFQGSEMDMIILSCVRSSKINDNKTKGIGFLNDCRRVNVALTRARHSLWIVGNCDTLINNTLWRSLINDAHKNGLVKSPSLFYSQLSD